MKAAFTAFGRFIEKLVEQHKLVRRGLVVWIVVEITWVVDRVFTSPHEITAPEATAFGVLTGLLTLVLGFYQRTRSKEDGDK